MKRGAEFESLIESIYKKLDATSEIKRNDRILGADSNSLREIDLSIRSSAGIHRILIIVQVKDHARPLDINTVGEFHTVIRDTRAHHGVLIAANGFTQRARTMARSLGIEIYTAHDTQNPKWRIKAKIPVVLTTFEGTYRTGFKVTFTDEFDQKVAEMGKPYPRPENYIFTPDKGKTAFLPIDDFRLKYKTNLLSADGKEQQIDYPDMDLIIEDGVLMPASEIRIEYKLAKKTFYKYFALSEFKGLVNKLTDAISPTHFKLESDELVIENSDAKIIKPFNFSKWGKMDVKRKLHQPLKITLLHYPKMQTVPSAVWEKLN